MVFGHYLLKYNLMKMGFNWRDIDDLHPKEVRMITALYGAMSAKEQGFG